MEKRLWLVWAKNNIGNVVNYYVYAEDEDKASEIVKSFMSPAIILAVIPDVEPPSPHRSWMATSHTTNWNPILVQQ